MENTRGLPLNPTQGAGSTLYIPNPRDGHTTRAFEATVLSSQMRGEKSRETLKEVCPAVPAPWWKIWNLKPGLLTRTSSGSTPPPTHGEGNASEEREERSQELSFKQW